MNMNICDAMLSDVPGIYAVDCMAAEDGSRGQQIRDWVATALITRLEQICKTEKLFTTIG